MQAVSVDSPRAIPQVLCRLASGIDGAVDGGREQWRSGAAGAGFWVVVPPVATHQALAVWTVKEPETAFRVTDGFLRGVFAPTASTGGYTAVGMAPGLT